MTLSDRKKTLLAELSLLTCGVIWGSGFAVMKNTLDYLPVNWMLTLRFFFAGIILFCIRGKHALRPSKVTLWGGIAAGVCMYIAFLCQTIGLTMTTAGSSAFLTAIYVVLVPFLQWAVKKKRPSGKAVIAAALCFTGVGVIAVNTGFSISAGDAWTLAGGVLFASHLVAVAYFMSAGADVFTLTSFQMLTTAALSTIAAVFTEPLPAADILFHPDVLWSLAYLILFSTLYTMGAQNVSLRYAPTSHASLLMSTEAPFGFLFGILLLGEPFTLRFVLGATLIVASIVYSELGGGSKYAKKARAAPAQAK